MSEVMILIPEMSHRPEGGAESVEEVCMRTLGNETKSPFAFLLLCGG